MPVAIEADVTNQSAGNGTGSSGAAPRGHLEAAPDRVRRLGASNLRDMQLR